MPEQEKPSEAFIAKASSQLDAGLKSCRTVVEDYRAILSGDHGHDENEPLADIGSAVSTGENAD